MYIFCSIFQFSLYVQSPLCLSAPHFSVDKLMMDQKVTSNNHCKLSWDKVTVVTQRNRQANLSFALLQKIQIESVKTGLTEILWPTFFHIFPMKKTVEILPSAKTHQLQWSDRRTLGNHSRGLKLQKHPNTKDSEILEMLDLGWSWDISGNVGSDILGCWD